MEFIVNVASIFCIEFYTNWDIWIANASPIDSIIFEWFYWNGFIGGALAMVRPSSEDFEWIF